MTDSDLVPVFDGHNDTLLRLYQSKDSDVEKLFIDGKSGGHIDLPRARAGGLAGGMFAIFPPPVEKARRSAVPSAPSD
ncbi:membrane dipeptidase, partial [Mesorhizobium sp. Cs1321R2N1]|uniref:membrane dipeptidase n=1 Tax=Mesorhizobium sp. Cs1321R2N1 TaxID=3015174 RepID=UPI00301CEE6A